MITRVEELQIAEVVNSTINKLTSEATMQEIDTLYNEGYTLTKEDVHHLALDMKQDIITMLTKSN